MNEEKKNKIIGLGDHSFRKSYFPELQRKVSQLNLFRTVYEKSQDQIIIFSYSADRLWGETSQSLLQKWNATTKTPECEWENHRI